MANDDWVEDVRRWYYGGNPPATEVADSELGASNTAELGYETAHPSLQARHWPDASIIAASAKPMTAPSASR
jgi:hypothetical protein